MRLNELSHGSLAVQDGKLTGRTDTDYFYFFCPKCEEDRSIMVPINFMVRDIEDTPYTKKKHRELKFEAKKGFTIVLHLACNKCGFEDFVKISSMGWQMGTLNSVGEIYNLLKASQG